MQLELPKIQTVDYPVSVEIEKADEIRVAVRRSECRPEQPEVETVDDLVAVGVSKESEEPLSVAEAGVAARLTVAITIEALRLCR